MTRSVPLSLCGSNLGRTCNICLIRSFTFLSTRSKAVPGLSCSSHCAAHCLHHQYCPDIFCRIFFPQRQSYWIHSVKWKSEGIRKAHTSHEGNADTFIHIMYVSPIGFIAAEESSPPPIIKKQHIFVEARRNTWCLCSYCQRLTDLKNILLCF